jgi:tRNA 5-carboxymethoxyuridine methyltransferase
LARADTRFRESGVRDRISLIQATIHELCAQVKTQFDVVLCHAVLEYLPDPETVLADLATFVNPRGYLSLLFYNRNAALQRRIFRGEYAEAIREFREGCRPREWGSLPLSEAAVREWVNRRSFTVRSRAGIRIFHDYLPENIRGPDRLDALLEVERAFRREEPFASLGHRLHLICERS